VSGPAAIVGVLARISEIQSRIGALPGAAAAAGGSAASASASTGGLDLVASPFAAVLADTASSGVAAARTSAVVGGVVTSAAPASWAIPWVPGTGPVASASPSGSSAVASGSLGDGSVGWPLNGTITQRFGPTACTLEPPATVDGTTYAHYHDGLDIGAAEGTPVKAVAAGTVEYAGRYPDGAVVVRVRHADGSVALYAHLQPDIAVQAGDAVAQGETLGQVGMTGNTTGPHLHLELTVNGKNVDPLGVIRNGGLAGQAPAPSATGSSPASPLAAADGKLTQAALDRFDAVASQIPYHAEIRDAAVRAGMDPLLLASLVKAESGFRADAVSSAGAQGLCQLMPATARSLGVADAFDPVQNLRAGARYFANNLGIYGRTDLALAAYHDGKGAVAAAGGVPAYPVTHRYIDRICSYWTTYREATS
jgi:murein DD-endopeptidase MepM/ murein hydrolase activator NlpD